MAIAAHLEETPPPDDEKREVRRKLLLEAQGVASGRATNVLVHNMSATGLLLESGVSLESGETIEIELPHAGSTSAKVIWTSGNLFGCQFRAKISPATLSAAQLQSAIREDVDIAGQKEPHRDEPLGLRLRRLRKQRGLTLSEIAARLGVSKPTVWAWEHGKARPVESRMEALAQALDVPSSELLTGRDTSGLQDLLARTREQLAGSLGVSPDKIKIMIEL